MKEIYVSRRLCTLVDKITYCGIYMKRLALYVPSKLVLFRADRNVLESNIGRERVHVGHVHA
jgi:hypothetical protein